MSKLDTDDIGLYNYTTLQLLEKVVSRLRFGGDVLYLERDTSKKLRRQLKELKAEIAELKVEIAELNVENQAGGGI